MSNTQTPPAPTGQQDGAGHATRTLTPTAPSFPSKSWTRSTRDFSKYRVNKVWKTCKPTHIICIKRRRPKSAARLASRTKRRISYSDGRRAIPTNLGESHGDYEHPETAGARNLLDLRWVEDKELTGASSETLRKRYAEMKQNVPEDMRYDMFLAATPEAVGSILSLIELPIVDSSWWRDDAPFLLAVMQETEVNPHGDEDGDYDPNDPHNERNWHKPVFKVPVEIIPQELWLTIERDFIALSRLTRGVKGSLELGGAAPENKTVEELT